MMRAGSAISLSPSFSSYSNTRLAEVAALVGDEFGYGEFYNEFYIEIEDNSGFAERGTGNYVIQDDDDEEEDDDEFAFVKRDSRLASPVSADEIFCDGQIRPVYQIFDSGLFPRRGEFEYEDERGDDIFPDWDFERSPEVRAVRLPLRELFVEERETTMTMDPATWSSSSSEADELEGVPEETYCVWRPKAAEEEDRSKKSISDRSDSKRWKFKDLLRRSLSEGGKDRFLLFSRSINGRRRENEEKVKTQVVEDGGEKRRLYLPYRKDLMGLI